MATSLLVKHGDYLAEQLARRRAARTESPRYVCRECDLAYTEEADSPNPSNYRLYKCPGCGHRLGILSPSFGW